jgi:hypothetical protein
MCALFKLVIGTKRETWGTHRSSAAACFTVWKGTDGNFKKPFYSLHEHFNNCVDGPSEDLTGEFIILFFLTHNLLS